MQKCRVDFGLRRNENKFNLSVSYAFHDRDRERERGRLPYCQLSLLQFSWVIIVLANATRNTIICHILTAGISVLPPVLPLPPRLPHLCLTPFWLAQS